MFTSKDDDSHAKRGHLTYSSTNST